jgi:tetratricopeptide (TPR) repeat protein
MKTGIISRNMALVLAVCLAAYGAILWNGAGFSHPDDPHAAATHSLDFRPLLTLSYGLNRYLGGGWMAVNLLLHAIASVLVLSLSGNVFAACLFAAHPLAADAIASVSGRSSILCAVFVLAALVSLKHGHRLGWLVSALCAFASKEEAAALLLLTPLLLWIWGRRKPAIYFAIFGLIFGSVIYAMSLPKIEKAAQQDLRMAVRSTLDIQTPRRFVSTLGGYVLPRLFIPFHLSGDPDPKYSAPTEALGWATLLVTLPMAPYILGYMPQFLEHRAYLTIAWASMLAVALLQRASWMRHELLIPIIILFIGGSIVRTYVYSSSIRLYEDAVVKSPNRGSAHVNLGHFYFDAGRKAEAAFETRKAVEVEPTLDIGWKNLIAFYFLSGNIIEASKTADARDRYFQRRVHAHH